MTNFTTAAGVSGSGKRVRLRGLNIRTLRLVTGLILFSYAASHLLSHATGLLFLDSMERFGRGVVLAPWRTLPGRALLIASLVVHAGLGLVALVRRRHLTMPPVEGFQLALGLLIPLLLLPHITNVRLGWTLYRLDDGYFRILYQYWITSPLYGLSRQFALMVALWTHGCVGLYMWLRFRPWWRAWRAWLLAAAIALPAAAMLGIVNAGWDAELRSLTQPGFSALHGPPPPDSPAAAQGETLQTIWQSLQVLWIALVAAAFAGRAWRLMRAKRLGGLLVTYPSRKVTVPRGYTLLEASRMARVRHASLCGGRARCSTCRVRVVSGLADLPAPDAAELAMLSRIQAPANVRLACQTRPAAPVSIVPLVQLGPHSDSVLDISEWRESLVTVLSVDLRESTRMTHDSVPFDALFLIDRYVAVVTEAVRRRGGHVTSVAGDGVMSVFGANANPIAGARAALATALDIWTGLLALDSEGGDRVQAPVRFGMGLHTGVAILRDAARSDPGSLQFLGDTGNVAARLESMTKDRDCVAIASTDVFAVAGVRLAPHVCEEIVAIRGREADLRVVMISDPQVLADGLSLTGDQAMRHGV